MDIKLNKQDEVLKVTLSGRLDADTAPELKTALGQEFSGVQAVEVDLCDLDYISSAGLRTLLWAHKELQGAGGAMTIRNCNEVVADIFNITGFADVLNFA